MSCRTSAAAYTRFGDRLWSVCARLLRSTERIGDSFRSCGSAIYIKSNVISTRTLSCAPLPPRSWHLKMRPQIPSAVIAVSSPQNRTSGVAAGSPACTWLLHRALTRRGAVARSRHSPQHLDVPAPAGPIGDKLNGRGACLRSTWLSRVQRQVPAHYERPVGFPRPSARRVNLSTP